MELMELLDFLRARLDEDEQVARAATSGPWVVDASTGGAGDVEILTAASPAGYVGQTSYDGLSATTKNSRADAQHIARHDPARVLREVEAKRGILDDHEIKRDLSVYEQSWGGQTFGCIQCHEFDGIICGAGYCPTLRFLALPYADHPEYDEVWKP